ncbi:MAG: class I SAM-dependent methyltransferase [Chloroflexia bacterium]|nr:class I SAM-dependent methyltransferase [Chloroflexia bacterium]
MGWIIGGVAALAVLVLLFIVVTDGRYFGKALTYWIYNRLGPALFGAQSETERWDELAEALGLRGDETILDVGTAVGDLPLSIAGRPGFHGQVYGLDWSPRMIARARSAAARRGLEQRAHFQVADARQKLPFATGRFDVVICLGLLEALPQPETILRELHRLLRDRGQLVLSLYRGGAAWRVALSLDWYRRHLQPLGLSELRVLSLRRHHDVVIARRQDVL